MRGIHDCRQEITFEGRPDLVVHDSGGFEAGGDDEIHAIESFLKDKSSAPEVKDRLHVIWCKSRLHHQMTPCLIRSWELVAQLLTLA